MYTNTKHTQKTGMWGLRRPTWDACDVRVRVDCIKARQLRAYDDRQRKKWYVIKQGKQTTTRALKWCTARPFADFLA